MVTERPDRYLQYSWMILSVLEVTLKTKSEIKLDDIPYLTKYT